MQSRRRQLSVQALCMKSGFFWHSPAAAHDRHSASRGWPSPTPGSASPRASAPHARSTSCCW
eukprot:1956557-Prymnesium_polylepis.1